MNSLKKKLLSKIYSGYGFNYYPVKFKKKFEIEKKFINNTKQNKFKKSMIFNIQLASLNIKTNSQNIWMKNYHFKDREDFSALNRWTWAIKMISKRKSLNKNELKFIENSIFNWCVKYNFNKIDKKNIIFEPYNISERISNYLVLIKLNFLKPDKFVLSTLEDQYLFLLKNIELYKYKKSNHALNNLKAIFLFSIFSKNKKIQDYSIDFIKYLLKSFLDNNNFFKFGSSNYQFIFTKWICDIVLFSEKIKNNKINFVKSKLKLLFANLNYFIEADKQKNLKIPIFGNISPDIESNWIINFFFKKHINIFSKKYWSKISLKPSQKEIFSKEWFKIKNKNYTVFARNPKNTGFDFNHSHNDFFNFVIFYRGDQLIIDPGRENYSVKSMIRDVSGKSHNSFIINNKSIYDEFMPFSPLYRLGIKNEKNCKHIVTSNKKDLITFKSTEKNFEIYRQIKLKLNKVEILDKIILKNKSNIKLNFHLNDKNKNIRGSNLIESLNIVSDKKFKKVVEPLNIFNSYGKSYKGSKIILNFFNIKKTYIRTTLNG